ncbi:hypothetical protein LZL87_006745 [Fusarium oxysporum]|nr:hypothetical protein LZL87_006745 [Fusarium oxysporum]
MEGLTLNINTSKELGDEGLRVGGFRGMPIRRPHRFGEEESLDIEDLEASVVEFLQDLPKDKKLVLIGFGMGAEWICPSTNFPAAIPFVSASIDLRGIVMDITSSPHVKPRRGYHSDGNADNAGDDVVTTFALAHALLDERNHKTLLFEHACFRIASTARVRPFYDPAKGFIATVRTEGQLPIKFSSSIRLARRFFDFHPVGTELMSSEVGFATFRSQEELDYFISCVDGMVLYTGETLSAQRYIHVSPKTPEDDKLKEEKRMVRRIKREADDEEIVELGDLFS